MEKLLSVKNVFHYFKIVGIATIEMRVKIEHGIAKLTFSKSKMGILYNICLICLIGLSFGISFTYIFEEKPLITRSFSEKIKNANHAFNIISAIYVLGVFSLRQQSAIKIIRRIYQHKILFSMRINKTKPILMCIVFALINNIFIIIVELSAFWNGLSAVNVFLIAIFVSEYINNSLFVQYSMILELMNQFFESINHDLRKLSNHASAEISSIGTTTDRRLLLKIDKIFDSYVSLARLSKDISALYSEPMLICLPHIFISFLCDSYYFIKSVNESYENNIISIMIGFDDVFVFASLFVVLTTAAENTVSESKKTGRLVDAFLMSIGDQQTKSESMLNRFSHYLLHEKIRFDVYDLITLDQSLLMPIFGVAITYIVKLLHFPTNL